MTYLKIKTEENRREVIEEFHVLYKRKGETVSTFYLDLFLWSSHTCFDT